MISHLVFVYLMISIVILWLVTYASFESKRIILFLPFFLCSILFGLTGGIILGGVYELFVFKLIDLLLMFLFVWVVVIIGRKNGKVVF